MRFRCSCQVQLHPTHNRNRACCWGSDNTLPVTHILKKRCKGHFLWGGLQLFHCPPTTVRSGHLIPWRKPKPGCLLSIAWLFWAGVHLKFGRRWSAAASDKKKEVPPLPPQDFGTYREFKQAAAHRGSEGFNNGLRGASVAADPPDTLRSGPAASSRWVLDSRVVFFPSFKQRRHSEVRHILLAKQDCDAEQNLFYDENNSPQPRSLVVRVKSSI